MSRFAERPKIRYMPHEDARRPWMLESECVYLSDLADAPVRVPAGYRTDLASVPRVPGIYWRVGGKAVLPSIVHDWLYEADPYKWGRKVADDIFLEAMADEDDPPWPTTRWTMYAAVRMFGGAAWRRYRKA